MNAVLYARVSTEKQGELSIPAQLLAMRAYAQQHDWSVAREFVEPGASAKTIARQALQEMLKTIKNADAKVGVVLVHKIDRLARNVYDHATIRALLQQRGIRLASVVENVDDSVSGQLVENIMASIAQFYSANLGEEVKKGMRQKINSGGWPHLPPIGYKLVRQATDAKSTVAIDPDRAPAVRLAFELYATGRWGVRALTEHLRQEGLQSRKGHKLSTSYVRQLLVNPFYSGQLRWQGKLFPGKHPAIVPIELFNGVQKVIKRRANDPRIRVTQTGFPLKVVAACSTCRGVMTAEAHGSWSYYRCCKRMKDRTACSSRLCNAILAHGQVRDICRELRLDESIAAQILSAADALLKRREAEQGDRLRELSQRRTSLVRREMTLTQEFVAEKIAAATFQTLSETLRREIAGVKEAMERIERNGVDTMERVRATIQDAVDVWEIFGRMSPTRQSELIKTLFKRIVLGPTGVVGHVLHEPFASLFSQGPQSRSSDDRVSTAVIEELVKRIVAPA